jgi:hypothetical protein
MTKKTASKSETETTHNDCRQMALVLEGVAGTLHEGRPVPLADLQDVGREAQWVWDAGPEPHIQRAAEFEAARRDYDKASEGGAQGLPREGSLVARSAKRMAGQLRLMAETSRQGVARKELPSEVEQGIVVLAKRYARHARKAGA